jgi:hypothetical protein
MLRSLADRIEAGEFAEVESLFVLMPRVDDYPALFGFGDQHGDNDPRVQLALVQYWLLGRLVKRSS